MKIGSYTPQQSSSVLYAMIGDDCSLHHDLEELTPKQQADHAENQMLTCALQVALVGLGKSIDRVAMAKQFEEKPWLDLLSHYVAMFQKLALTPVTSSNMSFHPMDRFYEHLSEDIPPVDLLNLYMVSGSNMVLHKSTEALEISRNTNSKLHFAKNAPAAGIPVPVTKIYKKSQIADGDASQFFTKNSDGLMVKLLGLAGARNVHTAANVEECLSVIEEYKSDLDVLLQEIVDTKRFQEMTVDLTITPNEITINNVRKILFAGGKWVGNYIAQDLPLSDSHRRQLINVGVYARNQGHVAKEGTNCGIDYFIDGDDVIVTEINARWTGGLFPAEFLRKLDIREPAIAFFDLVPMDKIETLQIFQKKHLYSIQKQRPFHYIPMGFCPFKMDIDGVTSILIWQIVVGDFKSFVDACKNYFPDGGFPTADSISMEALE